MCMGSVYGVYEVCMHGCVCMGCVCACWCVCWCVCWLCMHESVCLFVWCVRSHARTMVFIIAMPVSWCSEPCLYHGVHHSHVCTVVFIRAMPVPWCLSEPCLYHGVCVYKVCMGCVYVCVFVCVAMHLPWCSSEPCLHHSHVWSPPALLFSKHACCF